EFFSDFYADFKQEKAYEMLKNLNINPDDRLKTMSKGTKEKVQLILVMSREAQLYLLDEPIGGVDPAARDYILKTILSNYNESATVLISTHLIADIENILDYVVFINQGQIVFTSTVDEVRKEKGKSVDALFREVFKC
ncbi:MAG TPA: ATP-binding cassette domain-containing protein, partial [Peptococcaceae bacterium]|nr:ATP-binding cassette domain-containing protein [Peptococcaceae bacterium]